MDNQVTVQSVGKPGLPLVIISWILLFMLTAFASIPFLGIASWLVAIPVLVMTLIFSIVILMNGRTINGIFILVSSLILVPVYIAVAPLVATVVAGCLMDGECEITITDSQGNPVKKRADLKHLTFSDWKEVDKDKGCKKDQERDKAAVPAPADEPGQVPVPGPSDKAETDKEKEAPAPADKAATEKEGTAPATEPEKLEYI